MGEIRIIDAYETVFFPEDPVDGAQSYKDVHLHVSQHLNRSGMRMHAYVRDM